MNQHIENIQVKDLVLWTENPRDPITEHSSDIDVIQRAVKDPNNKWKLKKLAHDMGEYYDFSELPIVVYKGGKPIVYDGNRRVALAKIKLGFVAIPDFNVALPDFPSELPCNVCSEEVALKSIYRKHVKLRNSWDAIERDIFVHKYRHEKKSVFLMFDEGTGGFITSNPALNQGFVRKEVLTANCLSEMGFAFEDGQLLTRHTDEEVRVLLDNLLEKIQNGAISTRSEYRGKPLGALDQRVKDIISTDRSKELRSYNPQTDYTVEPQVSDIHLNADPRKTRITKSSKILFWGEKLVLIPGDVNNLYSDISVIYNLLSSAKHAFSSCVYAILRMSLRLLCETASRERGYNDIKDYIYKYYPIAKKKMSQEIATLLSSQNVKQETLPQLLHSGAHNYASSTSPDQAICISIALGAMLKESHGKS